MKICQPLARITVVLEIQITSEAASVRATQTHRGATPDEVDSTGVRHFLLLLAFAYTALVIYGGLVLLHFCNPPEK